MTSIVVHKLLQALLMLATSDICPEKAWYGDEIATSTTKYVRFNRCFVETRHSEHNPVSCTRPHHRKITCEIPLTEGVTESDARAFYRLVRKMAERQ